MHLDGATLLAREILQAAPRSVECLVDRDSRVAVLVVDLHLLASHLVVDVFQSCVSRRFVTDDNRASARHGDLDSDVEVPALLTMPVRQFNLHPASQNAGIETFEPCDALTDVGVERVRG